MLMSRLGIVAVIASLCVGLGGTVAKADAQSPTVLQAISAAEHSVRTSSALSYLLAHTKTFTTPAGRKAALPRVKTVSNLYSEISHYVAQASAATATQKAARMIWARGAQLGSQEYAELGMEFIDFQAGDLTGAQASEHKAVALAKRATFDIDKADKLLGLPAGT